MKKTTVFTNLKSTYFQEKSYFNAIKDSKSVSFHLGARDGGIGPLLGATGGAESVETKRKCIHNNYEDKKNQSSLSKVQVLMFCKDS